MCLRELEAARLWAAVACESVLELPLSCWVTWDISYVSQLDCPGLWVWALPWKPVVRVTDGGDTHVKAP